MFISLWIAYLVLKHDIVPHITKRLTRDNKDNPPPSMGNCCGVPKVVERTPRTASNEQREIPPTPSPQQVHHHQQHAIIEVGRRLSGAHVKVVDINDLVLQTLTAIKTLVDNEQEAPRCILKIHAIAEREAGWFAVVKSLVSIIGLDSPLGAAVITLLMDECPLPSKGAINLLLKFLEILRLDNSESFVSKNRNFEIVLGCLAEKLAGPSSVSLLTNEVLDYLFENLTIDTHPCVILHALITLEKFSQTSENKSVISERMNSEIPTPLEILENWWHSRDPQQRQVGFCARWSQDNFFTNKRRPSSYEMLDLNAVTVMLNSNDASEYLKISTDGLEARCDASSFESVRCTFPVDSGIWYYEVTVVTPGVMQIGWATKDSKFLNYEGYGVGDDEYSLAYDGCRQLIWYNAKSIPHSQEAWTPGDVLGLLLSVEDRAITFSLNGMVLPSYDQVFTHSSGGYFAAASFMSFQQCEFNFGHCPFKFAPKDVEFKKFNDFGKLTAEEKFIIPRHKKTQIMGSAIVIKDNSCTLCFDENASIKLHPCRHRGFCSTCVVQLDSCPLCRVRISSWRQETVSETEVEELDHQTDNANITEPGTEHQINHQTDNAKITEPGTEHHEIDADAKWTH